MHYINQNYVLKPIYHDENESINDMLSLTLQVVDIFQTQSYTTIVEHQDENIRLESHANNQIFHQILVFQEDVYVLVTFVLH